MLHEAKAKTYETKATKCGLEDLTSGISDIQSVVVSLCQLLHVASDIQGGSN